MAVVLAYQSLNSNSSSSHGVKASNSQPFTRMTHNHSAQSSQPWKLDYPIAESCAPDVPVHGPAQLLPTAPMDYMDKGQHSDMEFLTMVEGMARQIYQVAFRSFNKTYDLLVLGELDSSHPEWSTMQSNAGSLFHSSAPNKACNCFSLHSAGSGAKNEKIAEGTGWVAVKCGNVVAVFVHVPNAIAKDESAAILFYQKINNAVLGAGKGAIDIIMGDTNQAKASFTPNVVSRALGMVFKDAHAGDTIRPADAFNTSFGGTNATASKKYDVAVYNTASIKTIKMNYLSQFSSVGKGVAAVTDHMGVGVYIEK